MCVLCVIQKTPCGIGLTSYCCDVQLLRVPEGRISGLFEEEIRTKLLLLCFNLAEEHQG